VNTTVLNPTRSPVQPPPANRRWRLSAVGLFVALAVVLIPLLAHGCHGDDVDHEPLFLPIRLNSENP
jgi:hypothetical protein